MKKIKRKARAKKRTVTVDFETHGRQQGKTRDLYADMAKYVFALPPLRQGEVKFADEEFIFGEGWRKNKRLAENYSMGATKLKEVYGRSPAADALKDIDMLAMQKEIAQVYSIPKEWINEKPSTATEIMERYARDYQRDCLRKIELDLLAKMANPPVMVVPKRQYHDLLSSGRIGRWMGFDIVADEKLPTTEKDMTINNQPAITLTRVGNGWVIQPAGQTSLSSYYTEVAVTPKSLAEIVEGWAKHAADAAKAAAKSR